MKERFEILVHQLTADKKKLGVMICALALGLLLWGRLLLQGVPRTATADDPDQKVQIIDSPDHEGRQSKGPVKNVTIVHVDLPAFPARDLFGIDPSRYRRTPGSTPTENGPKSAQFTPDGDPMKAAVREEAMELSLESVLTGTRPRAYINGHLLKPGDEYEGFTLLQVTDRHVLLTKYDLIIKLRM